MAEGAEACPQDALYFGWGRPALLKSRQSRGRFGGRYDFTPAEDLSMAALFVVVLATLRGLYGVVPFLATLGLAGIVAVLGVYTIRLGTGVDVRFRSRFLKRYGRVTRTGWVYATFSALLFAFVGHSAYIRYNEVRGLAWEPGVASAPGPAARTDAEASYAHLLAADRHGLVRNERVERAALAISTYLGRVAESERWALSILERYPDEAGIRLRLAGSLAARQRLAQAERHFAMAVDQDEADPEQRAAAHLGLADILVGRREWAEASVRLSSAIDLAPQPAQTYTELGAVLTEMGLFVRAQAALEEAISLEPDFGEVHYNLGTLQIRAGRFDEAVLSFERALVSEPDDGATLNNLGFALERLGRVGEAIDHLERAIVVAPRNADAHFNLARLLIARREEVRAVELLRTAAELDGRYRQFLQ